MEFKTKSKPTTEPKKTTPTKEKSVWRTTPTRTTDTPARSTHTGRIKLTPTPNDSTRPTTGLNPDKVKNSKFHTPTTPSKSRSATVPGGATLDPNKVKESKFHGGTRTSPSQPRSTTTTQTPKDSRPTNTKLTNDQIKDAKAWYSQRADQYTPAVIKEIQSQLGIKTTGKIDTPTLEGIAKWQAKTKQLPVNGSEAPMANSGKLDASSLGRLIPIGLATEKAANNFAKGGDNLIKNWSNLSEAQKVIQLKNLMNNELANAGIPQASFKPQDSKGTYAGQFNQVNWSVNIDADMLKNTKTSQQVRDLLTTVYHEARHVEQTFKILQTAPTTSSIFNEVPDKIANQAIANRISPDSTKSIQGNNWHDTWYGKKAANYAEIANKTTSTANLLQGNENNIRSLQDTIDTLRSMQNKSKDKAIRVNLEKQISAAAAHRDQLIEQRDKLYNIYAEAYDNYWLIPNESDAEGVANKMKGKMKQ